MRINPYINFNQIPSNTYYKRSVDKGEFSKEITPQDNLNDLVNAYGEKDLKNIGAIECATCASRTYVDGSDDPSVSFKTPTKIDPNSAHSAVMSHELEHVSNEQAKADSEGREVISQSVSLSTALCTECGRSYVSGGTTRTTTRGKSKYDIPDELLSGLKVDKKI